MTTGSHIVGKCNQWQSQGGGKVSTKSYSFGGKRPLGVTRLGGNCHWESQGWGKVTTGSLRVDKSDHLESPVGGKRSLDITVWRKVIPGSHRGEE